MKLLRFLERRLPAFARQNLLHKWVRTGQVRINGKRSGPFSPLQAGDLVRVPPFALHAVTSPGMDEVPLAELLTDPALTLATATDALLVLHKAGGLPVQPGTGHEDSVVLRLQKAFAGAPYIPAPAHRLDRHTSGLLLAGRSHAAQRTLHHLFAASGGMVKEYLAWVRGAWPHEDPRLLADTLRKAALPGQEGRESMIALEGGGTFAPGDVPEGLPAAEHEINALCTAVPLRRSRGDTGNGLPCAEASLLLVRLLTGRTHQIRVQLASRGFPVIGDGRYNGPSHTAMLLHAWRIRLPDEWTATWPGEREFTALPAWDKALLPEAEAIERASRELDTVARTP